MGIEAGLTLREGRDAYFSANGIAAGGGYEDDWVVIKIGGVPVFAFWNTASRKRDVPFHDIHHVLTGYPTTIVGEGEIGAWELGTDCTASPVAVFLNCQAFGSMLVFHPNRMFRAFLRGRRARNLYGSCYDDALLSRTVGEMREELRVDAPIGEPTPDDRRAFRRWSIRALIGSWGPINPIVVLAWWIWA
jgi:hypothetical protein